MKSQGRNAASRSTARTSGPRSGGPPLHGIWRILPSPALSEILAQSGLDFQILDREHGGYGYESLFADIIPCATPLCPTKPRRPSPV